jgi:hypothetical protein
MTLAQIKGEQGTAEEDTRILKAAGRHTRLKCDNSTSNEIECRMCIILNIFAALSRVCLN